MKVKIIQLVIEDKELGEIQDTHYLVNPDKNKLKELKHMIEDRFDYQNNENLSDEEIEKAEIFCDNIWDNIENFIKQNFVELDIKEVYEIEY